jgi:REP element-mobilizing transposase RayT
MCRGDRREPVFRTDADRWLFLDTLEQMCERTGILVHSYVLMPNHYHMLLETPEPNLVAGMKWFQGTYTQRFNRRHALDGHLFQGRYKAIPVDGDDPEYFRVASDYIHLNPARAGLLAEDRPNLRTYRWSSFVRFVGRRELPGWLPRARVFGCHDLPDEGARSRRFYEAYMGQRVRECCPGGGAEGTHQDWLALRRGWYLGSDAFRDRLLDRADNRVRGRKRRSYRPDGLSLHDEREAIRRLDEATRILKIRLPELWARRQTDPLKQAVAWWVKSVTVVGDEWVCGKLEMGSRTNVHRAVTAFRSPADRMRISLKKKLQLCAD